MGADGFLHGWRPFAVFRHVVWQPFTASFCQKAVSGISAGDLRAYYFGKRAIRIDPADLRAMRQEVNPNTRRHVNGGGAK